jgi:predicted AAA+ superfamily ATPase
MQRMDYVPRYLERAILRSVKGFGAVVVSGPRQAGKTWLLEHVASTLPGDPIESVAFDTPAQIDEFRRDPALFFANHPGRLLLDEVQHVPDIFPYLKRQIDEARGGFRFFISGSQSFELMRGVSESLAGRAAVFDLWPFSAQETAGRARKAPAADTLELLEHPGALEKLKRRSFTCSDRDDLAPLMLAGGYPPVAVHGLGADWLESYRRTYVERDIRLMSAIHDMGRFDRFVTLVAGRTGTVVNKAELSSAVGVDNKTIDNWIELLQATYQVLRLSPYFVNTTKRVVKRPKLHFADSGLGLHLQGIRDAAALLAAPHFGGLFESFVVMEIRKLYGHEGRAFNASFWRDAGGKECDLVLPIGGELVPVEIKHTASPGGAHCAGLEAFMASYPHKAPRGILISLSPRPARLTERVWNMPLGMILSGP